MKTLVIIGLLAMALVAPPAAHAKRYNLALNFGQDVLVVGKDDVGIRAQCVQNEGGMGSDVVRIYAVTANNAVLRGSFGGYYGDGSYLTPATPISASPITFTSTTSGQEYFYTWADSGSVLNLTTMHGYELNAESTVLGLNSGGDDCLVSVDVKEIKKFKEAF